MGSVTKFWQRIPDADNDLQSVRVQSVTLDMLAENIERAIKRVSNALDELDRAKDQLEAERERFAAECTKRGLFDGLRSQKEKEQ